MEFIYRAKTKNGEEKTGKINARSEELALQILQSYDFVVVDLSLPRAFESSFSKILEFFVFFFSALHSFAPHSETRWLHFNPHQVNDFLFFQAKLQQNGIKCGSVFPSHFDDSVFFNVGEFFFQFWYFLNSFTTIFAFKSNIKLYNPKNVRFMYIKCFEPRLPFIFLN